MKIDTKTVCIVSIGERMGEFIVPGKVLYQVTVDPALVSPSGGYIRFGHHPGDEIHGWQAVEKIVFVESLAEWQDDQPPEIHTGSDGVDLAEMSEA